MCELHFKLADKTGDLLNKALKEGALPRSSTLRQFEENSCRVCLTEIPTGLVPLFSTFIGGVVVGSVLEYCTSVEIRPTDSFPKFLCQECLQKLTVSEGFKKLTVETDKKLNSSYKNFADVKNEPIFVKIEPEYVFFYSDWLI